MSDVVEHNCEESDELDVDIMEIMRGWYVISNCKGNGVINNAYLKVEYCPFCGEKLDEQEN